MREGQAGGSARARSKVLLDSERGPSCACHDLPGLERVDVGGGTFVQSQRWRRLEDRLCEQLTALFAEQLDTVHLVVPSLISLRHLQQTGYFEKFPHQAQLVSTLPPDAEAATRVATAFDVGEFQDTRAALNPVTCYQLYANFAALHQHHGGQRLYTIEGTVFRYESPDHGPLRMNEFGMHETVFLGSESQVLAVRDQVRDGYIGLLERLRLPWRLVTASDPFYGPDADLRRRSQLAAGSKWELRVPLLDDSWAVGSLNVHGAFFVERFGLGEVDASISSSGCAGIGLDRLVYVLLAIHGEDAERVVNA